MADNEQTSSQPQGAGQPQAAQTGQVGQELSKDVRMWAMICHLAGLVGFVIPVVLSGIIAPLIVWQLKKQEHPFIDQNGKEALNFQISVGIYALIGIALCCVVVGFVVLPAVALFDLIFLLIAAVKANNGESYRYPLTIRFVK